MSSYLQSSCPGLTRCGWRWGLWAPQQAPFLFSSSVQNWVSQFSCPLSFRAESAWEPRADHLTPSDQQGVPFWPFPLLSVLFSSPFLKESAILGSKGSSFSSPGPSPGGKGGLGWQESDSKILRTATTAADQGTDLPDGQNTHGEAPPRQPPRKRNFSFRALSRGQIRAIWGRWTPSLGWQFVPVSLSRLGMTTRDSYCLQIWPKQELPFLPIQSPSALHPSTSALGAEAGIWCKWYGLSLVSLPNGRITLPVLFCRMAALLKL